MRPLIALLRGVNVGGRTQVPMKRLRALAADLGIAEPRTLLQSGNLVFRTDRMDLRALERDLEEALADVFGNGADVFLREAGAWSAAIADNLFAEAARIDPAHLLLTALRRRSPKKSLPHSPLRRRRRSGSPWSVPTPTSSSRPASRRRSSPV